MSYSSQVGSPRRKRRSATLSPRRQMFYNNNNTGKTLTVKGKRYTYYKSNRPGKKLMVVVNNKTIHFGASGMEHYYDKTGLLHKSFNHGDAVRRRSYQARHSSILKGDGKRAIDDPTSPAFHSYYVLW